MPPAATDKKVDKSYLSSAVDSINPWANSRAPTPTQESTNSSSGSGSKKAKKDELRPGLDTFAAGDPGDHSTTHLYGQSFRTYPADCPPLDVQWFHAVDVPKRKPRIERNRKGKASTTDTKPPVQPKKFSAFSSSDSRAIESRYQKLLEATEDHHEPGSVTGGRSSAARVKPDAPNISVGAGHGVTAATAGTRVPVNEDFLFDVDIEERELAPTYWLGPVYHVRRGTWFFQEGSTLRSCEENLAAQLEEGYLKMRPWLYPTRARSLSGAKAVTPRSSQESLKASAPVDQSTPRHSHKSSHLAAASSSSSQHSMQPHAYRLFGVHMNSVVTYHDASTAWLSSDTVLSWVTSSVYERFSGGGYMSGVKVVRGYAEPSKTKDKDKDDKNVDPPTESAPGLDERQQKLLKRRSAPPTTQSSGDEHSQNDRPSTTEAETRQARLQRQLSSLIEREGKNTAEVEEEVRKREEQEIQDDYNAQAGETQGRDIEHLVLVTHGIGQLLSLRMDSINFVHDVNVLRKTLKSVYSNSADLKALNSELGAGPGNSKVQVLPVCWRHLLDFPRQREKRGEYDLGDVGVEEDEYPSLEDITIEGVAFARSLISDLALDVLLYQSSYREEIARIVLGECNRIIKLFRERNPDFSGKVHVMGHSLGSAILFDILCRQQESQSVDVARNPLRFWPSQGRQENTPKEQEFAFEFDVDDFYCLGSPIGLFQMLKGRTIAARHSSHGMPSESPLDPDAASDPFLSAPAASSSESMSTVSGLPLSVSSPKVKQLFNIFHPSDPISYRLEPLISPAMASLKPQMLPYTKKGLFGNAPQGLTGIGAKVGQSVSGLWSSLSAGIASNLLNRSLGLSNEEVARMTSNASVSAQHGLPPGAGTNISAGGVISDTSNKTDERKKQLADSRTSPGLGSTNGNDPTLIDDELETLYSSFQKKRTEMTKGDEAAVQQEDEALAQDAKARKMRAEEGKIRAFNRNGRVDYSIQESVLDYNPINTIASHMGYWADEDVNHFVLSQLLSNKSRG